MRRQGWVQSPTAVSSHLRIAFLSNTTASSCSAPVGRQHWVSAPSRQRGVGAPHPPVAACQVPAAASCAYSPGVGSSVHPASGYSDQEPCCRALGLPEPVLPSRPGPLVEPECPRANILGPLLRGASLGVGVFSEALAASASRGPGPSWLPILSVLILCFFSALVSAQPLRLHGCCLY